MIVEMFLLLLLPPPLAAVHIAGWIRTCANRSTDSIHVYSSAVLSFPIPMFQWSLDSLTCFLLLTITSTRITLRVSTASLLFTQSSFALGTTGLQRKLPGPPPKSFLNSGGSFG
jgi:hypothetical protein